MASNKMKFAATNVRALSSGQRLCVDIHLCIADCYCLERQILEALSNYRQALQLCDLCQDIGKGDPIVIRALASLAKCQVAKCQEQPLIEQVSESLRSLKTAGRLQKCHCDQLMQLAAFLLHVGDADGAERSFAASDAVSKLLEQDDALNDQDPDAPWEGLPVGFTADHSKCCESVSRKPIQATGNSGTTHQDEYQL